MHLFLKVVKKPVLFNLWLVVVNLTVILTPLYTGSRTPDMRARFFYTSAVRPRDIDNLLAKKSKHALNSSKIELKLAFLDVVSILVSILMQRKSQTKNLVVNVNCRVSLLSNLSCVHMLPNVSMQTIYSAMLYTKLSKVMAGI